MWKNVVFGLLAILLIFGFIGCDNSNDNPEIYTVSIGTLTNGEITLYPTSGIAGTEITLTINPNNLYRLKAGTLKYGVTAINETTLKFILPSSNVIVNAEFESKIIESWLDGIFVMTFYNNNQFIQQRMDTKYYTQKGSWEIENPNKLFLTWEYRVENYNIGVATIEELILNEPTILDTYDIEYISNSSIKLNSTMDGFDFDWEMEMFVFE